MGTWGTGPFENDAAADLVADLEELDDPTDAVRDRLSLGGGVTDVTISEAQEIVAAAALVAELGGYAVPGADDQTGHVSLDRHRRDELARLVGPALDVISGPEGELASELQSVGLLEFYQALLRDIRGACLVL